MFGIELTFKKMENDFIMSIPIDLYEKLERKFGREEAFEIAKMIEDFFKLMERRADEIALQKKVELRSELVNELATKAELNAVKTELKADIERLRTELKGEIENLRTELRGEIENVRTGLKSDIEKVRAELMGEIDNVRTGLEGEIENLRTELKGIRAEFRSEIENVRLEFRGEIAKVRTELQSQIDKLNMKLNFLIILVIIVLTLMNPVVAELIKKWAGLR
jgi:predicted  nucleic acid-binding Zn-ribbon protein